MFNRLYTLSGPRRMVMLWTASDSSVASESFRTAECDGGQYTDGLCERKNGRLLVCLTKECMEERHHGGRYKSWSWLKKEGTHQQIQHASIPCWGVFLPFQPRVMRMRDHECPESLVEQSTSVLGPNDRAFVCAVSLRVRFKRHSSMNLGGSCGRRRTRGKMVKMEVQDLWRVPFSSDIR